MTTYPDTAGSGWFSKLVVVLLLAIAIGLYLQIVMVDGQAEHDGPLPQASVRVLEGAATPATVADITTEAPAPAAVAPENTDVKELPRDQMDLIRQVFAPELAN
jgi:hypothetical protein